MPAAFSKMSSLLPNSRTASEHSTPLSRRNETAAKPLARSNSIGSATSPSRLLRSTVMPSANRRPNKAGGGTQHTRVRGNADEDLVGERILELLRACEMSHHQDKESQKQGFRWRPLVSRHNWNALRNSAQQGFFTKQGIQSTGWGVVSAARRFLVNEHRPTRWSSILFFWRVIAFSLLALTAASVCLLVWSAHVLGVVVRSLAVVLVDWDELSRNRYYQTLTARAVQVYRAVDSAILQGRRFEGRSWNKDGYIFWSTTSTLLDKAANRDFTLWEIPPPKEKPLTKWSSRTLQHIYAIDYCYAMLAMEHLHRQNKQSRGQDEMSKLSKLPLSDDGDANNNMQIIRQDKGWHTDTSGVDRDFNNGMFENNQVAVVPEYPYVASENLAVVPDASRGAIEVQMLSSSRPLERCADGNMDWIDVGARIGMRLLNSEHIQRAMASQDTKDRIMETMGNVDPQKPDFPDKSDLQPNSTSEPRKRLSKPIHSMWTSPEAAALRGPTASMNSYMEHEDLLNLTNLYNLPIRQSHTFPASPLSDRPSLPTVSPRNSPKRIISDPVPKNPCNTQIRDYKGQNTSPLVADRDLGCPGPSVASLPPHINIISLPEAHDNSIEEPVNAGGFTCISLNKRCCGTALASSKGYRSASHVKGHVFRRTPLQPGVKVAIPLFPVQPRNVRAPQHSSYQMTTVVSSCRIYVDDLDSSPKRETNCLSVTVKLDKFFLRNGEFGELTFRVMDEWSPRYMPRHSKVAIGSCVATSFGIGVLVGWRVEDDCHVVRSLWRCRGPGSSHAYMNRQAIHSTTAAAVGFRVQTLFGWGIVLACVNGGRTFDSCRFFVEIREDCQHKGDVLELDKKEILSCHGAQFMPVIEHVREAALYQIQLDNYNAALREQILQEDTPTMEQELLRSWSACADILWNSFLKAVEEDKAFDDGVNDFMTSIITFLDRLDENDGIEDDLNKNLHDVKKSEQRRVPVESSEEIEVQLTPTEGDESTDGDDTQEPGFWIMNHLFGGLFKTNDDQGDRLGDASPIVKTEAQRKPSYYDRAFAVLRTLMKTVSLARAASVEHPHFRLALAITYDFLLFVRTIVKVQERNTSVHSLKVWKRAWEEIVSTFGPIKERLESIGRGIAYRMEHQGRRAKVRVLKFVDKILGDERLLFALEQGEWDRCLARLEIALVEAEVIKEENLSYYRKAAKFVYDHVQMSMGGDGGAATRNSEKLALLARFIQSLASPRRSVLKIFCRDDMLELFERILVRAYYKEEVATRMLTIHAANFHTLRHLRMLKDFSVAGRIWIPLLDAADEEFSWLVSTLPENSKEFMCPLSSLFSLCVSQFHKINAGDLSKDWLAFLLEEESARIINDIDMLLILSLEAFSRDIREMMTVLPYYPR